MAKRGNKNKRESNQETLGQVIDRMLNVYRLRSGLTEVDIKAHWPEIVGKVVADKTDALNLRGSKLFVKMTSAAMRQELHYQREDIVRNVNEYLKQEIVSEVILT